MNCKKDKRYIYCIFLIFLQTPDAVNLIGEIGASDFTVQNVNK